MCIFARRSVAALLVVLLLPAAAFAQRLRTRQHIGDVVVAGNRERLLGVDDFGVERAQAYAHVLFLLREVAARIDALLLAHAQLVDVASREVQPNGCEFCEAL